MSNNYLTNWKNEKELFGISIKSRLSIIDRNSLTNRLMSKENHGFNVKVLRQECRFFNKSMYKNLPYKIKGYGIYRKVVLSTNHYPQIEAYTFMLSKHISGKERFLKILGNRSLGAHILNTNRFKKRNTIYRKINNMIHRVSIYKYRHKKIYVNEIFPDNVELEKMSYLNARGNFTK